MKQLFIKRGHVLTTEVPAPLVHNQEILVRVLFSCISAGTEAASIQKSGESVIVKAFRQPSHIKQVTDMIRSQGLLNTIRRVQTNLNITTSIGYSASGIVLQVGREIQDIKPGDRVACAGAGVANHAEFIAVPRNLLVLLPQQLSMEWASTVALGSIAIQGIRRAKPQLGENAVVLGLGILGQLTAQLLKVNGCHVIGMDVDQSRIDLALSMGLEHGINASSDSALADLMRMTGGHGADAVLITASAEGSDVINKAAAMCRKKGKIIIVGDVGLHLQREALYAKELDVLISTSYGPGRYDDEYEMKGKDYPYAYVRWSENRNMGEYIQLLSNATVNLKPLIQKIYPMTDAALAYEELKSSSHRPLLSLLKYDTDALLERKIIYIKDIPTGERINVAFVGAGNFVKNVLVPQVKQLSALYRVYAVCTKTGKSASSIAQENKAAYSTTDYNEILKDPNIHMVIIATRHNLHASMVAAAAKAGKAIFVEKPMALNAAELNGLVVALEDSGSPFSVGFNRRYSPYAMKIKTLLKGRSTPLMINYRMNAGFIPKTHWVHSEEGGGRNIGEACHIYDLFNFFTESEACQVTGTAIDPHNGQYSANDNFVATVKYADGSVCSLTYTSLGHDQVSKEQMEIYTDGKIIQMDNYCSLRFFGFNSPPLNDPLPQKGYQEEFQAFAKYLKNKEPYPIPLWQLIQATEISFAVERDLGCS